MLASTLSAFAAASFFLFGTCRNTLIRSYQKRITLLLFCRMACAVGIFLSSSSLLAQERITAGIGMSLNPAALVGDNSDTFQQPFGVVTWYVPLRIGNHFRVEPEAAYFNNNRREQDNASRDLETRTNFIRVGMGVFYEWQPNTLLGDSVLRVYAGTRLGILSLWATRDYYDRTSGNFLGGDGLNRACLYYVAALGGEYLIGKNLGVGLEFQLGNYEFGEPQYRYGVFPPNYPVLTRYTIFASTALAFIRLYL
jgi:hypothetical protein